MNLHYVLLAAIASTAFAMAQEDTTERQSRGPFLAAPHGFSVAPGAVSLPGGTPIGGAELRVRASGVSGTTPGEFFPPTAMSPDYSTAAILQGISPQPDLDAFSVGLDWVVSDPSGRAVPPPLSWAGITFSVTPDTLGEALPNGRFGAIFDESTSGPGEASGDLFSYLLPGSRVPAELVDIAQRAQDSSELAVGGSVTPAGDLDAHDVFVALIWQENPDLVPLLPLPLQIPRAFFSVNASDIGSVPSAWWAGETPSGAIVFGSEWTGSAWTTPTPFLLPAQLGLSSTDDVDAVAVDWIRGRVLFSTTRKSSRSDPILFASGFDAAIPPSLFPILPVFPYTSPGQIPREVSRRIGLARRDDVDALCALDPGQDQVLAAAIGQPFVLSLPPSPKFAVTTVFRNLDPVTGQPNLSLHFAGWPPPVGRAPGQMQFFISVGRPSSPVSFTPLGLVPRNVATPFGGGPVRFDLSMPPIPPVLGMPIYFWAVTADFAGNMTSSRPVRIDV